MEYPPAKTQAFAPRWPFNLVILGGIGIPAFTGFPLGLWSAEIVTGIGWSNAVYWVVVLAMVRWLLGVRSFSNIVAVAALITLPVVFVGGTLSTVSILTGISRQTVDVSGMHYAGLCLTMLTVVPLALAMVALIPFGRWEQRLLFKPQGVSARQKKILMVLRVFNHIAFNVLPGTLEILREERLIPQRKTPGGLGFGAYVAFVRNTFNSLIYLAVGTICAALQYIPLWASEIGHLPEKPSKK
jgi:hypothetical protein